MLGVELTLTPRVLALVAIAMAAFAAVAVHFLDGATRTYVAQGNGFSTSATPSPQQSVRRNSDGPSTTASTSQPSRRIRNTVSDPSAGMPQ